MLISNYFVLIAGNKWGNSIARKIYSQLKHSANKKEVITPTSIITYSPRNEKGRASFIFKQQNKPHLIPH